MTNSPVTSDLEPGLPGEEEWGWKSWEVTECVQCLGMHFQCVGTYMGIGWEGE